MREVVGPAAASAGGEGVVVCLFISLFMGKVFCLFGETKMWWGV